MDLGDLVLFDDAAKAASRSSRTVRSFVWVWGRISFQKGCLCVRAQRLRNPANLALWLVAEPAIPQACEKPRETEKSRIGIKTLVLWQLELLVQRHYLHDPASTRLKR